jgi:hypothetical protein
MGKQLYRTQVLYNIVVSRRYSTYFKISYPGDHVYYIHVTDDDQVVRCYIGLESNFSPMNSTTALERKKKQRCH